MKTVLTAVVVLFGVGLLAAACGGSSTPATPAAPTVTGPPTEIFSGTLAVRGSSFYSFTVGTAGQVSITLASLLTTPPGPALSTVVLGLGLGTPLGTDCSVTNSVTAAPALTAQLISSLTPATYCARVFDLGSLAAPVMFTVRIVHS
jgi:hypothetical protein